MAMDEAQSKMESEEEAFGGDEMDGMDVDDDSKDDFVLSAVPQTPRKVHSLEALSMVADAELLLSLRFGN